MRSLILASTSPYRRALLERLGCPFEVVAPEVDETPRAGETAPALAGRLAQQKALAVATRAPDAVVIGSDQVACLHGKRLGKPGNAARTIRQLSAASGNMVEFFTGLSVCVKRLDTEQLEVVPYRVQFRVLSAPQIAAYVARETPYDCAGGFKAEGLGITLFERLEGTDPTALIGLPLIALVSMLRRFGIDVLTQLEVRP